MFLILVYFFNQQKYTEEKSRKPPIMLPYIPYKTPLDSKIVFSINPTLRLGCKF